MRFVLDFTDSALEDLAFFKKYEQTLILDQIEVQLSYEPLIETRNRKPLEPNTLGEWELRVGMYRVFYDVAAEQTTVKIKAVGYKEHTDSTSVGRSIHYEVNRSCNGARKY